MAAPLDALLTRLTTEAEAQDAGVRRAAREEADALVRDARAAADRALTARLAAQEAAARAEGRRMLERVRQQDRRTLLEVRHEALDAILTRVAALLPAATSDSRYTARFGGELAEAVGLLGGPGLLRVTPALCEAALAAVPPCISVQGDPGISGFILQSSDGRLTIDGTLAAQLRRLRPELMIAAARVLEQPG